MPKRHTVQYLTAILVFAALSFSNIQGLNAEMLQPRTFISPDSNIGKFLLKHMNIEQLEKYARTFDQKSGFNCNADYKFQTVQLLTLTQVQLDFTEDNSISGAWNHRYLAARCGNMKHFRDVYVAKRGQVPRLVHLFPGTTAASPRLMRDVSLTVLAAAGFQGMKCNTPHISDTAISQTPRAAFENGKIIKGVWREIWTVHGCGKDFMVQMKFWPDGKGGTYFASEKYGPKGPQ